MKREDLKHLLQLQLGWDNDLAEQVLAQVKQLALQDEGAEIDEIVQACRDIRPWRSTFEDLIIGCFVPWFDQTGVVQNYMADSPSCQEAVHAYVKALQNDVFGPGMKLFKRPDHTSNSALSPAVKPGKGTTKARTRPATTANAATTAPAKASSAPVIPAQSMTVRKGNVSKHAPKVTDPAHDALKRVNRKVFNCLSCGKVCQI